MDVKQLMHNEISNDQRCFPVKVVCDSINSAENVGMIFRVSEALGVKHIYLCGSTKTPKDKKVLKTTRSTEKNISYSSNCEIFQVVTELKKEGYTIVSLEITNASKYLDSFYLKKTEKLALIIGNEKAGVSGEVLMQSDSCLAIRMFGKNTSMNVVNALSIALYEITRQMFSLK